MTQSTHTAAKPTHRLYRVEGEGKSAKWTEIGAAWPNKDGRGYSLNCAVMPLQGRIVMREVTEAKTGKPAAKAA